MDAGRCTPSTPSARRYRASPRGLGRPHPPPTTCRVPRRFQVCVLPGVCSSGPSCGNAVGKHPRRRVGAPLAFGHDDQLCELLEDGRKVVERPRCRHRLERPILAPIRKPAPSGWANYLALARVLGLPPDYMEGDPAVLRGIEPVPHRFAHGFPRAQPAPIRGGSVGWDGNDRSGVLALAGGRGTLRLAELGLVERLEHAVAGAGHDATPSISARARAASD